MIAELEEQRPPPGPAIAEAALVDLLVEAVVLQELSELGFDLFQMVFPGFPDTSDMRLFVDEVLPRF